MRRRAMGVVVAIAVAVAVALQWLPPEQTAGRSVRADATEVTLSLRSDGPALRVVHGGIVVTFEF